MEADGAGAYRQRTAALLHRVSRALRDPQAEAWLTLDLSMAQLKVLFCLFYRGPATVGALAHSLGVKLPTVSATLDRTVKAGYVERVDDPEDRRVVINRLTPAGSALVERLREERRLRVEQALGRLSPREVAILHEGLTALAAALGLACATPTEAPVAEAPAPA